MIQEEELKKIVREKETETKMVKIHQDRKKQIYTIRLPVTLAKAVNLTEKDKFQFILVTELSENGKTRKSGLRGELIRG